MDHAPHHHHPPSHHPPRPLNRFNRHVTVECDEIKDADRLNNTFGGVYHLLEHLFDGRNPYMECIERNLNYLEQSQYARNGLLQGQANYADAPTTSRTSPEKP